MDDPSDEHACAEHHCEGARKRAHPRPRGATRSDDRQGMDGRDHAEWFSIRRAVAQAR
jgi:hypothetical protein